MPKEKNRGVSPIEQMKRVGRFALLVAGQMFTPAEGKGRGNRDYAVRLLGARAMGIDHSVFSIRHHLLEVKANRGPFISGQTAKF